MIGFFVTRAHRYTIDRYLASTPTARAVASRVEVIPYEDLPSRSELPRGTYVFSDLERLDEPTSAMAADAWEQLAAAQPDARLLNHPTRSLRRYDLLCALHAAGINPFRAYRVDELEEHEPTYPVFLRYEHLHGGALTGLLRDRSQLDRAIARAERAQQHRTHLLVVEFAETVDAHGLYRKYGAWRIGDHIIAANVMLGGSWVVKRTNLIRDEVLAHARKHMRTNPHEEWARRVFEVAGLQYGRLDYGVDQEGRTYAWEINTNPMLMRYLAHYKPILRPFVHPLVPQFAAAFNAIDSSETPTPPVAVRLGPLPARHRRGPISSLMHRAMNWSRRKWERRAGRR